MGYPGEDLSVPQLLFALNTKFSERVHPFDCSSPSAGVQAALATVGKVANAHLPVTRLPAEILASVPIRFDPDVIQFNPVRLMHVCWYWRDTLVSARLLWYIGDLPAPLPTVNLNRSGSASIWLNIDKGDHDRFVAVVSPYQEEHNALWLDLLISAAPMNQTKVLEFLCWTEEGKYIAPSPSLKVLVIRELDSTRNPELRSILAIWASMGSELQQLVVGPFHAADGLDVER